MLTCFLSLALLLSSLFHFLLQIPLLDHASLHTHNQTLTITCTCCYDEIKGTQVQDLFSCSFSDSLSLSVVVVGVRSKEFEISRFALLMLILSLFLSLSTRHNHTITHSHTLLFTCTRCYDQSKGTKDQDFSYSCSDSLSTCQ